MMHLGRFSAASGAIVLATFGLGAMPVAAEAQPAPATSATHYSRCEVVHDGIEYRSYLPDQKRYVYVAVKILNGMAPSVFVIVDKNYEAKNVKPTMNDPLTAWWLDRSRPMTFSTDKVKLRWPNVGGYHAITSWVWTPDDAIITQPIRGLEQSGSVFVGNGSGDSNTYAFQTRIEMPNFEGSWFDATLPSVSYDGVLVTPPVVHFERDDEGAVVAKCG